MKNLNATLKKIIKGVNDSGLIPLYYDTAGTYDHSKPLTFFLWDFIGKEPFFSIPIKGLTFDNTPELISKLEKALDINLLHIEEHWSQ